MKYVRSVLKYFVFACLAFLLLVAVVAKFILFAGDGDTLSRTNKQCAIVFGARVYPNGYPSDSLYYRTLTAIDLYKQKYVEKLIFSGGKTDGIISEAQAMKNIALSLEVPEESIHLDDQSFNTFENFVNSANIAREIGCEYLVGVSHYYHLGRISMLAKSYGVDIKTIPATGPRLKKEAKFFLREIAAVMVYSLSILAANSNIALL